MSDPANAIAALCVIVGVCSLVLIGVGRRRAGVHHAKVIGRLQQYLVGVEKPHAEEIFEDDGVTNLSFNERAITPLVARLGRMVLRRTKQGEIDTLRLALRQAGSTSQPEAIYAAKLLLCGAVLLVGLALCLVSGAFSAPIAVLIALVFGWAGFSYPNMAMKRRATARAKDMRRALPGCLDTLTVCMEGGLPLDVAIQRYAEYAEGALAQEFAMVLNEIRLGRPRLEALSALTDRTACAEVHSFVRSVRQAEPLGVSLVQILRTQSEEVRRERRQRAEETGRKAPILMLLPMVGCIFPCIFMVLLGPAGIVVTSR